MPSRVIAKQSGSLSRQEFDEHYLLPRQPLVLRNAMSDMPAVGKWSVEFFRNHYGRHHVPIDGLRSGKTMRLGDYVNSLDSSQHKKAALYMRNLLVFERFPELKVDFKMPWISRPNWLESRALGDFSGGAWRYWVELFLSGKGSKFPFVHLDPYYTHAWSIQLSGQKTFYLWAPLRDQHAKLLKRSIERIDSAPLLPTTHLPTLFPKRACYQFELSEGDLAFIPAGWWHTTETLEASVTLGGNFVEGSNWREFKTLYQERNPAHTLRQVLGRKITSALAPRFLRVRGVL